MPFSKVTCHIRGHRQDAIPWHSIVSPCHRILWFTPSVITLPVPVIALSPVHAVTALPNKAILSTQPSLSNLWHGLKQKCVNTWLRIFQSSWAEVSELKFCSLVESRQASSHGPHLTVLWYYSLMSLGSRPLNNHFVFAGVNMVPSQVHKRLEKLQRGKVKILIFFFCNFFLYWNTKFTIKKSYTFPGLLASEHPKNSSGTGNCECCARGPFSRNLCICSQSSQHSHPLGRDHAGFTLIQG